MEAAAIGVQTPSKGNVRAFILAQDCPGRFMKNLRLNGFGRLEGFPSFGEEWVGRIGDRFHGANYGNVFESKAAYLS